MHRRRVLQAAAGLCLPARVMSAGAETAIDGRGGRFDDDFITHLEGHWAIERQIRGMVVHNTLTADWVLAHQWLRLQMQDTATPSRYEALVLIGYRYASREYVAHWTDTFGGKFSAVGHGRRDGDAVEFRFEYPDGPFFNTFRRDAASDTWQMRLENGESDGSRSLFALDDLRRA